MNPVVDQIDLLHQLAPEAKKVGLLYCTAESNSKIQIELAAAELKKLGIEGVEYTASSSNEVQQVVESMMGKVDAIYTPTDNTIASAMTVIASIANEHKVPTVCGEVAHVEAGGLASLSINYEELGRRAARWLCASSPRVPSPPQCRSSPWEPPSATWSTTGGPPRRSASTSPRWSRMAPRT